MFFKSSYHKHVHVKSISLLISPFHKYILHNTYKVVSGKVHTYMLEKSRVVYQQPGEKNFHLFHYLMLGAEESLLNSLGVLDEPRPTTRKGFARPTIAKSRDDQVKNDILYHLSISEYQAPNHSLHNHPE
jgi:hypothetical protein